MSGEQSPQSKFRPGSRIVCLDTNGKPWHGIINRPALRDSDGWLMALDGNPTSVVLDQSTLELEADYERRQLQKRAPEQAALAAEFEDLDATFGGKTQGSGKRAQDLMKRDPALYAQKKARWEELREEKKRGRF